MDYKKAYQDLLIADRFSLRERLVMDVIKHRPQYTAGMATAAAMTLLNFIEGSSLVQDQFVVGTNKVAAGRRGSKKGVKRGPYKKKRIISTANGVTTVRTKSGKVLGSWDEVSGKTLGELPVKASKKKPIKRPYTKKASYWKNPSKAKKAKAAKRKK